MIDICFNVFAGGRKIQKVFSMSQIDICNNNTQKIVPVIVITARTPNPIVVHSFVCAGNSDMALTIFSVSRYTKFNNRPISFKTQFSLKKPII
jgi:hypothetical protein